MRNGFSRRNIVLVSFLAACALLSPTASALTGDDLGAPFWTVICALFISFVKIIPALAIMIFIVAGALWIYSQDDAAKRNTARVWVTHVIIGAIIATLALAIASQIGLVGLTAWTCPYT